MVYPGWYSLSIRYMKTTLSSKITAKKHVVKTFERLVASLPTAEQTKVNIEKSPQLTKEPKPIFFT